ncbi:MAG: cytochrome c biogenesis protein DipZ [Solirubrobacterales bacterium]
MVLLMIFAFIAGAATALSPCALPVLPVVFAAGSTGGRRRPLGIATGLAISFTFAVVVLVYVLSAFGLPDDLLRDFAIAVLLVFGLSLVVPKAAGWVEFQIGKFISRGASKVAGATQSGAEGKDGFWSGVLVGGGLGFVYAPCAGPILAGVITATASQAFSAGRLAVALSYGVGSSVTFFALMIGGRRLIAPLMRRGQKIQLAMGLSMVFVAMAMFADLDTRFQTAIASGLPAVLVNPTGTLEKSGAVRDDLAATRGNAARSDKFALPTGSASSEKLAEPSSLPDLGEAPEFAGNQKWFNTADGRPLTLKQLRGKVVLVDFWTYTCINCIRTQPYLKSWDAKYRDKGFVIVGVHTPEFPFERSAKNVRAAIKQSGLRYPIAQDNDYATWNAYGNQYWPAHYLVDATGRVRQTHFGEGKYKETEEAIRSLLAEAGGAELGSGAESPAAEQPSDGDITPEAYLGSARANSFTNGQIVNGRNDYGAAPEKLPADHFAYSGSWQVTSENATSASAGSRLEARFNARRVFLVLGSNGPKRSVIIELDGKPIAASAAGADVRNGVALIGGQRLYRLVDLPGVENHRLTLRFTPGVSAYAFTFG